MMGIGTHRDLAGISWILEDPNDFPKSKDLDALLLGNVDDLFREILHLEELPDSFPANCAPSFGLTEPPPLFPSFFSPLPTLPSPTTATQGALPSPLPLSDSDEFIDIIGSDSDEPVSIIDSPPPSPSLLFSEPAPSILSVKNPLSGWSTRFDIIAKCLTGCLPETKPDFISKTHWTAVMGEAQQGPLTKVTGIQKTTILERSITCTIQCSAPFCDVVMTQGLGKPVSNEDYPWLVKSKYFGAKSKKSTLLDREVRHLTFKFPVELGNHPYFKRLTGLNLFVTDAMINGMLRGALVTYYINFIAQTSTKSGQTRDECILEAMKKTSEAWNVTMVTLEPVLFMKGL